MLSLKELLFFRSFYEWKYSEQIFEFQGTVFSHSFVCGSTQNRFWVSRNCFFSLFLLMELLGKDFEFHRTVCGTVLSNLFLFVEVLGTDFKFGGTVLSHCFCLWKCSEQILSFKELFFLIIFARRSTGNRFWVCGTVFSHFFCLWKYSEQILSSKELFFLIIVVCASTRNRC